MREASPDVLVVGAGIIGLACARELARAGLSVEVLERGRPGARASSAAAGMLAPLFEAPRPGPFFDACRAARDLWREHFRQIEDESGREIDYDASGALVVALDEAEEAQVAALARAAARLGEEAREVDPRRLGDVVPDLASPLRSALHLPGEHRVDNARATDALAVATQRAGARIRSGCEVRSARLTPGAVTLEGAGFERSAGAVVLAAGAWSAAIEGLPGLPIRPVRGQMIRLGAVRWPWSGTVRGAGLYAVRRAGDGLLLGATVEEAGFDDHPTPAGVASLLEAGARLLPGLAACRLEATWAGLRPGTPDDLPFIGPLGDPRIIAATGHYRNGILLAPWTARAVCAAILGDPAQLEPAFLPDRALGTGLPAPREEALEA